MASDPELAILAAALTRWNPAMDGALAGRLMATAMDDAQRARARAVFERAAAGPTSKRSEYAAAVLRGMDDADLALVGCCPTCRRPTVDPPTIELKPRAKGTGENPPAPGLWEPPRQRAAPSASHVWQPPRPRLPARHLAEVLDEETPPESDQPPPPPQPGQWLIEIGPGLRGCTVHASQRPGMLACSLDEMSELARMFEQLRKQGLLGGDR